MSYRPIGGRCSAALTEILVLGRLYRRPRHGYDIRQSLQQSLGGLVQITNGQLYPALHKLESEGAVTRSVERQEGKPDRHLYTITADGRARLRAAVADLPPALAAHDTEFYVRVAWFGLISPEARIAVLRARRGALLARRERVSTWGAHPAAERAEFLRALGQLRAETFDVELAWLDRQIAEAEREIPASGP